ncbi:hypothetical protein [Rhizobium oryziradicis]|uniref:Uncharacterized protein n=1 Tax=Rhizobium oryziradicis TaxID=1867956 RepID=A0A1Q8ZTJ9_9HYPH|nr:hypothetical protein [Rhizobium oryziradicis]OLP45286.1 hypothetical protein BJF95_18420 [Rhizobium oryziradicis]
MVAMIDPISAARRHRRQGITPLAHPLLMAGRHHHRRAIIAQARRPAHHPVMVDRRHHRLDFTDQVRRPAMADHRHRAMAGARMSVGA